MRSLCMSSWRTAEIAESNWLMTTFGRQAQLSFLRTPVIAEELLHSLEGALTVILANGRLPAERAFLETCQSFVRGGKKSTCCITR